MKISDLIRALEHVKEEHGDLLVLEQRQLGHSSTELFADTINIDTTEHVADVASWYETYDNRHHYHFAKWVGNTASDRREFKAFVL